MKYALLITAAALTGAASAGVMSESEPNNTLAFANDAGTYGFPGGTMAISGVLDVNDVDWYSFTLTENTALAFFSAFGVGGGDGAMQIVGAGGDVLAFNDDANGGLMPSIQMTNLDAGTYYLGFSGFGDAFSDSVDTDELFDGVGHNQAFAYKINLGFTVVPAPSAMALLGLGGLAATRRRR